MSKAAEAFRTISEVASDLDVPKHVLRFWEAKFPQVRPMKRGGGRRYYRPGDMELLRGIRHLLHAEGYTIKGVQKILREQGIDAVKAFGRDDRPVKPADIKARSASRATGERQTVAASTGSARPAAGDTLAGRALIARMITELEACRELLRSEGAATQTARGGRKPRAVRG